LGWSCQASERRPIQRDEQAIAQWKRYQWPAINKSACQGAHLTFLDESGFLLMPIRPNTWAPAGHTFIITYHDKHDRISTLAGLTVSPKRQPLGLYFRFYPENFQAVDVADYLWVRLHHLRGRLVRLWKRGAIHKGPVIEAVCQSHPRLHVEVFPAYALELNPSEQVWNDFKGHMVNSLLRDTRELCRSLQTNVRRIRR
jgi:hypothetical protein